MKKSLYTLNDAFIDYLYSVLATLSRIESVSNNIRSFVVSANSNVGKVAKKLALINSKVAGNAIAVLDPTRRLISLLGVERIGGNSTSALVVYMKPPILPHFFLSLMYIVATTGMTPVVLAKLSPVLTLVAVLSGADTLSSSLLQGFVAAKLLDAFAKYEVSVLPLTQSYCSLPVKPKKRGILYLCNMGLSTAPLGGSYNVELDLSDIPPVGDETIKKEFIPLKLALDEVLWRE